MLAADSTHPSYVIRRFRLRGPVEVVVLA